MKYALVTSSTKGIGKAIGLELMSKGYYVFFNYYHDDNAAIKLSNELLLLNNFHNRDNYAIIKSDMTTYEGIEIIYKSIVQITNQLDCIILNTGITCRKSIININKEEFVDVINTNALIPFFLLQKLYDMISDGNIIFIGSILGQVPHSVSIPYAVSKAAVSSMAKNLVKFYKQKNVRVNVVSCGFIETEWHKNKTDDMKSEISDKISLGRFGKVKEVAQLVMSICDNEYINGADIILDGGYDFE